MKFKFKRTYSFNNNEHFSDGELPLVAVLPDGARVPCTVEDYQIATEAFRGDPKTAKKAKRNKYTPLATGVKMSVSETHPPMHATSGYGRVEVEIIAPNGTTFVMEDTLLQRAKQRVELSSIPDELHDILFYEWGDVASNLQWLLDSTDEEIIDWAETIGQTCHCEE